MIDLRESILSACDRKTQIVEVPEWPCGAVYVRTLSAKERMEMDAKAKTGKHNWHALVCSYIVCDPQGRRVFGDEDVEKLAEKSGPVLDRLIEAAFDLIGGPKQTSEDEKNS